MRLARHELPHLLKLVRHERHAFAGKIRVARAVLGWSQTDLALRVGLTQRAIHKLEQGNTEPRRATVHALDAVWREQGLEFEELSTGGFRVSVHAEVLNRAATAPTRRLRHAHRGLTITGHRAHRT